jgi:hypothetical protein
MYSMWRTPLWKRKNCRACRVIWFWIKKSVLKLFNQPSYYPLFASLARYFCKNFLVYSIIQNVPFNIMVVINDSDLRRMFQFLCHIWDSYSDTYEDYVLWGLVWTYYIEVKTSCRCKMTTTTTVNEVYLNDSVPYLLHTSCTSLTQYLFLQYGRSWRIRNMENAGNLSRRRSMKIHKEMWLIARLTKIWRGRGCFDFFLLHDV